MYLESAHPGQDASVRATLGHFFVRDARNRDHTGEFTVFGAGEWEQERVITSVDPFGLQVPFYIDGDSRSFDDSSRQTIDYDSDFSSFEANYRVKGRLSRDQMIMDPNGQWHRSANSGFEREYLVGLRFMEIGDQLDWRAEDIVRAWGRRHLLDPHRQRHVRVPDGHRAHLPGAALESRRDLQGRRVRQRCDGPHGIGLHAPTTMTTSIAIFKEDELSFIGEFKLLGRFHVTPSISLRAAYEMMYIESVALAPSQANFITGVRLLEHVRAIRFTTGPRSASKATGSGCVPAAGRDA